MDYTAIMPPVAKPNKAGLVFEITSSAPCGTEPSANICLYQALPKGDKLELIIQKCVELGVSKIIPIMTERCVTRLSKSDISKKATRYQRIAESAAGQSMRGKIPEVSPACLFVEALSSAKHPLALVAHEQERTTSLKSALVQWSHTPVKNISIWIGPEGGFTSGEISTLGEAGAVAVSLGPRVLRTETAAISAVAQIICLCEE